MNILHSRLHTLLPRTTHTTRTYQSQKRYKIQVFGSGDNSSGQLGTGDISGRGFSQWTLISEFDEEDENAFVKVSTGNDHTLFLSQNGFISACGSGDCGQNGMLGSTLFSPKRLQFALPLNSQIFCGLQHTALLSKGACFTFGSAQQFQLGYESDLEFVEAPKRVSVDFKAMSVGFFHTLAVSLNGEVYSWGFFFWEIMDRIKCFWRNWEGKVFRFICSRKN
eukprot:TRINITY_DN3935_c0_g1_i1.p1 TRINITY_DN3935_c0_g1~~TRINITY_DN3935_c0_g1_i1.p1  ORF type:complete len:222 (+),score=31.19 TRINITY_DN3935_c0_g1_i1:25-690(+)